MSVENIESVMQETRKFAPSSEFASQARMGRWEDYEAQYRRSIEDPEGFWGDVAQELHWFKKWDRVLDESDKPFFKWFTGGKLNACYNCVDRHVLDGKADREAIIFEGEPGDLRTLTYGDLHREVQRFANVLKRLGIQKGDTVAIYLPMVPELAIAVLACARIGAVHSVIFAGFSAESIKDRVLDGQSKLVITGDGSWRRGNPLKLKEIVDQGVKDCACVKNVLTVARNPEGERFECQMKDGRDHWYHDLVDQVSDECPCEELDSEDLLFLLYTSGSTGKPKGIMHTVGGYSVYTYLTTRYVFDLREEDVYWCTADVGWITGHSYLVYGPLQNCARVVMYEGAPNHPEPDRFWQMVERHKVTVFYTAPTAIRAFMKWGDEWVAKHDLSSLRLLGTVGEPINPEAWIWYHEKIGGGRCPIVDTWWQTETGGILLSPLPGVTPTKPGSATKPFFGVDAAILDAEGNEQQAGLLAIRKPWPSILRGIWGDPERFKATYWNHWNGQYYFPGDGARLDDDGYFWIVGRVDDVVNVSGHRIGTAELESVFVEHPNVAESAVIGVPHDIKGQGLVAFVLLRGTDAEGSDALRKELNKMVEEKIGKFARPEKIIFSADLPKTRSGKIMRRLLRDIATGRALGNVTTLADPSVVEKLKSQYAG
ncbi:MAG: acetate--CoA ligase [Verrucomicrobiota bacterium JB022]|nr:acetate--CoA ligase [Verrucomicrobiota bacterium JB022]